MRSASFLTLFCLCLLFSASGHAQTLQSYSGGNFVSSATSVTYPSSGTVATTTGNFVAIFALVCNSTNCSGVTPSLTSALGNTYSACPKASQGSSTHGEVYCWYSCAVTGGADNWTVTLSGQPDDMHIAVAGYTGIAASACADASGAATSTSASPAVTTSGSVSQSNELVLAYEGDWDSNRTATAGSGYTIEVHTNNSGSGDEAALEDNNVKTGLAGTQTAGFGGLSSDTKQLLIETFLAAGSGGGSGCPRTRLTLGVGC